MKAEDKHMSAKVLDGKVISDELRADIAVRAAALEK